METIEGLIVWRPMRNGGMSNFLFTVRIYLVYCRWMQSKREKFEKWTVLSVMDYYVVCFPCGAENYGSTRVPSQSENKSMGHSWLS